MLHNKTIRHTTPSWGDTKRVRKTFPSSITEEPWKIISSYYKECGISGNHLDSFSDFTNEGMQEIIDRTAEISMPDTGYRVVFGHISLAKPHVSEDDRSLHCAFPVDARLRNLNYDAAIHVDITEFFPDGEEKKHNRVMIGRMPIMLRSSSCNLYGMSESELIKAGECPNDPGGYFIINGNERILSGQIHPAYDTPIVCKQKKAQNQKNRYTADIRSMSKETGH